MRRSLRRAGWALAAAGGLGLSGSALAQSNSVHFIGPAGHASTVEPPSVMNEGQARYEESQVELAWLAEPMLFSLNLGAQLKDNTFVVRGYVPTASVRDQALKVAREQTAFQVVDELKIYPALVTRGSFDKPEAIQQNARQVLAEQFPEHGKDMEVKCDLRGRVTVTGPIGSYEEKVLVSRKLRQVAGCNCVVNQLMVTVAMKDGRARSMVTADGKHVVVDENASSAPGAPTRLEMPKKIDVEGKPTVLTHEKPAATGAVKTPPAVVTPPHSNDPLDLLPAPRNTSEIGKPRTGNDLPKSDSLKPPPLPTVPTPTEWSRPAQTDVPTLAPKDTPKNTVPSLPPVKDVPQTALPSVGEVKMPTPPPAPVPEMTAPLTFPKTSTPSVGLPDLQPMPPKTEKTPDAPRLPVIENGSKETTKVTAPTKTGPSLDLTPIKGGTPDVMPPLKDVTVPALPDKTVPPTTSKGPNAVPSYSVGTISFADDPAPIKPVEFVPAKTDPKLPPPQKITAPPAQPPLAIKPVEMKVPAPEPKPIVPEKIVPDSKVPVPPTMGTLSIKPVEMKVPTPAPILATPGQIRAQILKTCGTAREVEVIAVKDKALKIRFRASSDDEAKKIFDKISSLSELVPYDVTFDVRVTSGS
jgi:BON domain